MRMELEVCSGKRWCAGQHAGAGDLDADQGTPVTSEGGWRVAWKWKGWACGGGRDQSLTGQQKDQARRSPLAWRSDSAAAEVIAANAALRMALVGD